MATMPSNIMIDGRATEKMLIAREMHSFSKIFFFRYKCLIFYMFLNSVESKNRHRERIEWFEASGWFQFGMKHVIIRTLSTPPEELWPKALICGTKPYTRTAEWFIEAMSRSDEVHGVHSKQLVPAYLTTIGSTRVKVNYSEFNKFTNVCIIFF